MGISNGAAYYILSALIKKGFVKLGNFKKNSRKNQYAYLLTPEGLKEKTLLAFRFIQRKKLEYKNLRKEIDALEKELKFGAQHDHFQTK